MLEVAIKKQMPGFTLSAEFSCRNGQLVVFTGPSGAGKTTLIRILAGLESADQGSICYQGRTWYDSARGIHLPPKSRELGYVFQEHTLFPHLSVKGNVGFMQKNPNKVNALLRVFKIQHIADHKPHQISGGERQRTAFAQALAKDPKLLLLDEPFSALDSATRNRLQYELKKLRDKLSIPILHVTHDLTEVEYLADKIVHIDRKFPVPRYEQPKTENKVQSALKYFKSVAY